MPRTTNATATTMRTTDVSYPLVTTVGLRADGFDTGLLLGSCGRDSSASVVKRCHLPRRRPGERSLEPEASPSTRTTRTTRTGPTGPTAAAAALHVAAGGDGGLRAGGRAVHHQR